MGNIKKYNEFIKESYFEEDDFEDYEDFGFEDEFKDIEKKEKHTDFYEIAESILEQYEPSFEYDEKLIDRDTEVGPDGNYPIAWVEFLGVSDDVLENPMGYEEEFESFLDDQDNGDDLEFTGDIFTTDNSISFHVKNQFI